jgi:8-oxo-dGTP diphosphatase
MYIAYFKERSMSSLEKFHKPSVTVDLVLMTVREGRLSVLLQKRPIEPFAGFWTLPGGFVNIDESLEAAAERILIDKAHMAGAWIEQLYTFGAPDRDPRGRVITVAYFALMPETAFKDALVEADDLMLASLCVPWIGEEGGPIAAHDAAGSTAPLGFDHADILGLAVKRLRGKLDYTRIGFALLPERFTLRDLQIVHEAILSRSFNKPAFRRRMIDKGWIEPTGERETGTDFRPAELYRTTAKNESENE